MAIGKAGAYATVTAPNVDFGKIALNAQQAQQADFEMIKSMIPKPEKREELKLEKFDADVQKTGNGGYDQSITKYVDDALVENLEIDKEAERLGRYTPELLNKKQKLQNRVKGFNNTATKFTNDSISFSKDLTEGKYSNVDNSRFGFSQDIAAKRNLELAKGENGETLFKVRDVDPVSGAFLLKDGKPVYKKFNDRGVERDYVTEYELENGSFFNNSIKQIDTIALTKKMQDIIAPETLTTDVGGVSKRTKTTISKGSAETINGLVDGVFSTQDNVASYLYERDPKKYSNPKTMEQYEKDGDLKFAKEEFKKGVYAGFGLKDITDNTKPNVTNVNVGAPKDPSKLPTPSAKAYTQTWKNAKGVQRDDIAKSTVFSINRGSSVKALGETAGANVFGREDDGAKRYFIQVRPTETQSARDGKVSGSRKISTTKEFLFFDSDADDANDVLSFIINPSTGAYFTDTEEAKEYIDSKMIKKQGKAKASPKGKSLAEQMRAAKK